MTTRHRSQAGFTLIELLTVIAIIAILSGFTLIGIPRIMETARLTSMENSLNQIRTILTDYYATNGTYPPRYGYVSDDILNLPTGTPDRLPLLPNDGGPQNGDYVVVSYLSILEDFSGSDLHGNFDIYDPFSNSGNTSASINNTISYLEFSPTYGSEIVTNGVLDPTVFLYEDGTIAAQNMATEVQDQLDLEQRPFLYFPVNKRQMARVAKDWETIADGLSNSDGNLTNDDPRARDGVQISNTLKAMVEAPAGRLQFPPKKYDAYVLIGVGPTDNLWGLLHDLDPTLLDVTLNAAIPTEYGVNVDLYRYHMLGMAVYYLATRDANNNSRLDFDYRERKNNDEGAVMYDIDGDAIDETLLNQFPHPNFPDGPGPIIYVSP